MTDWAWCFDNPKDAAAYIDKIDRDLREAKELLLDVHEAAMDDPQGTIGLTLRQKIYQWLRRTT